MRRVTGIGGIFFKATDPKALQRWYERHLGLPVDAHGAVVFQWREADSAERPGCTVWAPFSRETEYFAPSRSSFMINYRVDDLDAVLSALREEGVAVDDHLEESEFGRFGWVTDPEGNRIELWEPPIEGTDEKARDKPRHAAEKATQ